MEKLFSMKKYKLIKEYPGSLKLDTIVKEDNLGMKFWNGHLNKDQVLNQPEFWKEVIETPEYVECISWKTSNTLRSHIEGKIYKVFNGDVELEKDYLERVGLPTPYNSQLYKNCFKPSTKEAYDKQNQPKQDYEILSFIYPKDGELCFLDTTGKFNYKRNLNNLKTGTFLANMLKPTTGWEIYQTKRLSDGETFTIGDKSCVVQKDYRISNMHYLDGNCSDFKYFSTKEAAQIYVDKHTQITISSYKAEKTKDGFKFGCKNVSKDELISLHHFMDRNEFSDVSFGEHHVTLGEIEKLLKIS